MTLRRATLTVLAVTFTLSAISVTQVGTATQKQERGARYVLMPNEPVEVIGVRTKAFVFKGKRVPADNDWLQGLTVSVKNTSGKVMTYVSVGVLFLRPEDSAAPQDPPFNYELSYGVDPALPAEDLKNITSPPRPIMPGETVDLSLSEEEYASVTRVLRKLKYPESIKQIELSLEVVAFDDGMRWSGRMFRRDRNEPDKWVPVEDQPGAANNSPPPRRREATGASSASRIAELFPAGLGWFVKTSWTPTTRPGGAETPTG